VPKPLPSQSDLPHAEDTAGFHLPGGRDQGDDAAEVLHPTEGGKEDAVSLPAGRRASKAKPLYAQRVRELPPPPRGEEPLVPPPIDADQSVEHGLRPWWRHGGRRQVQSCLTSCLVHMVGLVVMAMIVDTAGRGGACVDLIASMGEAEPWAQSIAESRNSISDPDRLADQFVVVCPSPDVPDVARPDQALLESGEDKPAPTEILSGLPAELLSPVGRATGGGFEGRGPDARPTLAADRGGTGESEQAVERGLRWLMVHQREDGGWSFDLKKGPCQGMCRNSGTEASTTAATAIALLPFLGAGYTHAEGEYQDAVRRGLYYLGTRARATRHGADLQDGTMYAQGLAAIAICEAYAMTKDQTLKDLAQGALDFIVYAQDLKGGGWRYSPGDPGDTTVTGWQLMALKSGQLAGLRVPSPTIAMAQRFLESVAGDDGAQYGYMTSEPRQTTTAIGLLLRMYTGWHRDHPGLKKGAAHLGKWGPSEDNMYFNYYAMQVLYHWEGPEWPKFNRKTRDWLVSTQAKTSHEAGSWHFSGGRGDVGGRLYNTAMAVMTLEVYYRHMPLYTPRSVEDEF